ncbi:hypothetical protein RUND412_011127, partial [Rhizina undulata]
EKKFLVVSYTHNIAPTEEPPLRRKHYPGRTTTAIQKLTLACRIICTQTRLFGGRAVSDTARSSSPSVKVLPAQGPLRTGNILAHELSATLTGYRLSNIDGLTSQIFPLKFAKPKSKHLLLNLLPSSPGSSIPVFAITSTPSLAQQQSPPSSLISRLWKLLPKAAEAEAPAVEDEEALKRKKENEKRGNYKDADEKYENGEEDNAESASEEIAFDESDNEDDEARKTLY